MSAEVGEALTQCSSLLWARAVFRTQQRTPVVSCAGWAAECLPVLLRAQLHGFTSVTALDQPEASPVGTAGLELGWRVRPFLPLGLLQVENAILCWATWLLLVSSRLPSLQG